MKIKIRQTKCRCFPKSNSVGFNRLLVLVHLNKDNHVKRFEARRYHLSRGITSNYNFIINEENFYNQTVDSDIR